MTLTMKHSSDIWRSSLNDPLCRASDQSPLKESISGPISAWKFELHMLHIETHGFIWRTYEDINDVICLIKVVYQLATSKRLRLWQSLMMTCWMSKVVASYLYDLRETRLVVNIMARVNAIWNVYGFCLVMGDMWAC